MMIDWFGRSRQSRGLAEQLGALRIEIESLLEEQKRSRSVEAEQQASIAALKQSVDAFREHGALMATEVSELRDTVEMLDRQAVRSIEWRAVVEEDGRHRLMIEQGHMRLEMTVQALERRLQLQVEQAAKTATALLERIEQLRRPVVYDHTA